jgi:hypothetical protein
MFFAIFYEFLKKKCQKNCKRQIMVYFWPLWAGRVAQVVVCLTTKCKALRSNPLMAKKKKKKNLLAFTFLDNGKKNK